jgi:hypothetical protein
MLFESKLPAKIWGYAILYAAATNNATPTSVLSNDNPYRAWHNYAFKIKDLKVFGCLAYAHIQKQDRLSKLQHRAVKCIFLGYPPHHSGYQLLELSTKTLIMSRDVVFKENIFPSLEVTVTQTPEEVTRECGCQSCINALRTPAEGEDIQDAHEDVSADLRAQNKDTSPGDLTTPLANVNVSPGDPTLTEDEITHHYAFSLMMQESPVYHVKSPGDTATTSRKATAQRAKSGN